MVFALPCKVNTRVTQFQARNDSNPGINEADKAAVSDQKEMALLRYAVLSGVGICCFLSTLHRCT